MRKASKMSVRVELICNYNEIIMIRLQGCFVILEIMYICNVELLIWCLGLKKLLNDCRQK